MSCLVLLNHWANAIQTSQECSFEDGLSELFNLMDSRQILFAMSTEMINCINHLVQTCWFINGSNGCPPCCLELRGNHYDCLADVRLNRTLICTGNLPKKRSDVTAKLLKVA